MNYCIVTKAVLPSLKVDEKLLTKFQIIKEMIESDIMGSVMIILLHGINTINGVMGGNVGTAIICEVLGIIPCKEDLTLQDPSVHRKYIYKLDLLRSKKLVYQAIYREVADVFIAQEVHENKTPFREKVWQEIEKIVNGETRTYSELAILIGNSQATRAVAQACGANNLSLIIPCHRVVSKDPKNIGYHWGPEIKLSLLSHEEKMKKSTSI